MITCYDAINSKSINIPTNAPAIAYYVNGLYAWSQAEVNRFQTLLKIKITVDPDEDGEVLDVENGNGDVGSQIIRVPEWMDRFNRLGLYCNKSTWPSVIKAVGSRKAKYWIASPGSPIIPNGALARQYGFPGIYDVSVFDESWWPHPVNGGFKDVDILMNDGHTYYTVGNNSKHPVASPAEGSALATVLPVVKEAVPEYLNSLPTV